MKTYSLWWGESYLVGSHDFDDFLYELTRRDYHKDAKWIDSKFIDAILNRMAQEPNGIVLVGTTPAFVTDYGDRVPPRGYQIIWKESKEGMGT